MAKLYDLAYFGDKIVPLSGAQLNVASSAVLYGLSVYTVFPVLLTTKGLAFWRLADHYERLVNSARIIGLDTFASHWSYDKFAQAAQELIGQIRPADDVFVRATVHVAELLPGLRSHGLATTLSMFVYDATPIISQDGARLKTSVWRRVSDAAIPSRAKVNGAYVNSVLAKQDALDCGYDDCIFLDSSGQVCELSAANIFIVRGGVLITPSPASDLLEGITRRTILELASELGIKTQERSIDLTELYVADEVFASGTSVFIAPVKEIDGRVIGSGQIGPVTAKIKEKYQRVRQGLEPDYFPYLTFVELK